MITKAIRGIVPSAGLPAQAKTVKPASSTRNPITQYFPILFLRKNIASSSPASPMAISPKKIMLTTSASDSRLCLQGS